jgi:hypothetical protein
MPTVGAMTLSMFALSIMALIKTTLIVTRWSIIILSKNGFKHYNQKSNTESALRYTFKRH